MGAVGDADLRKCRHRAPTNLPERPPLNAGGAAGCNGYLQRHRPRKSTPHSFGNAIAPIARTIAATLMIIIVPVHLAKFDQTGINTHTHTQQMATY